MTSENERSEVDFKFGNEEVASAHSKLHEVIDELTGKTTNVERRLSGRDKVPQPKIQKVPQVLRDEQKNFQKYYHPKWISIGPIHHGNPKFRVAEQRFKFLFAAEFVKNSGHQSQEHLYKKVMENIKVLKLCFDDEVLKEYYRKDGKDDEALGWMLFLDGCFTLQFIYSTVNGESMRHFEIKNDQVAFVFHDFFLLENQIPYLVLSLLMENSEKEFSKNLEGSIKQFLSLNVLTPEKYGKPTMVPPKDYMPVHLLDFLRLALLQTCNKSSNSCIYTYLLACLPKQLRAKLTSLDNNNPKTSMSKSSDEENPAREKPTRKKPAEEKQQTFRSVMDLKAAGINLKRSKSSSLKDIKFSSRLFSAELELPPITVDDSMAPKFLNLIAFEMCPDNTKTEYEVSSYISFLDSLIDYPNDVKELRSSHVLHNLLGCDKEVAQLFNEMGRFLVPNPEAYEEVISQIEKHYHNKCLTWIAQVLNEHFSTPWTIVTFVAAFLALGMSFIQTYYTIYPRGE
ncbi:UPF0481 protein At3g47200-like [Humulus lupulus]|uniref:UPF0481 protein At3g47200-like n=1 Tax=Humulus lupulus TaxID=3486 RepID=UPI002B41801D|nr:UPF0481 protein At3g47200-like [Humulus lupulus]